MENEKVQKGKGIESESGDSGKTQSNGMENEPIKIQDNLDRANITAERIERATKELRIENDRAEKLAVQARLGGRSEKSEEVNTEDKEKEAARKLIPESMWETAGLE